MPITRRYPLRKLEPAHPSPKATEDAVGMVEGSYVAGQVLGQVSASHRYGAYADGNSDGTQTARALAKYDMSVDADGNVTLGSGGAGDETGATYPTANVYLAGPFRTEDLTGLDANAVADLGRLVEGDTTSGLLHVL